MLLLRRVCFALLACILVAALASPGAAQAAPKPKSPTPETSVSRARVAADVLMQSYDQQKAWFPSSWWNSAVALHTIGDYMERTGDRRYLDELDHTFERNKGPFAAGELSTDEIYGNFTSRAIDDGGWWALNWIQAYDLTGEQKYLEMAVKIAEYMHGFWDPSTCGGGIWWDEERTYKNAVTNGQYVRITAELHNRIPGDTVWLERAEESWSWYLSSGMINSDGLVNDGLNDDCQNNGQTVWTYNQALAIGSGIEIWRATGDRSALAKAKELADAAIREGGLVSDGVLTEACDALDRTCDDNGKQFKGIFLRYLMDLADTTGEDRYRAFVITQARTIWEQDRDIANRLGVRWSGASPEDHPNAFDWRTQASALSALIAAVPERTPKRSLSTTLSPARSAILPATGVPTEVQLDLAVQATGKSSQSLDVQISLTGPDGWTITPDDARIRLRTSGNARPAERSVPVTVAIPAGVGSGRYQVRAAVTSGHKLRFTAGAEIQIANAIDFDTGTADEVPWLWDADGSGNNGPQNRFADGNSYFIYKFPFPSDATSAQARLTIDNQYLVDVSPDAKTWTTVLHETEEIRDGSNKADHTIDLTPYLGRDGEQQPVYLRVRDSFPDDGWGGRLLHVAVEFS
jgi:predicted alpha-1,6-mannanase (GH76 family)